MRSDSLSEHLFERGASAAASPFGPDPMTIASGVDDDANVSD
jgi:hypothetical protein